MAVLPTVTVGANEGAFTGNLVNAKNIAAAATDTLLVEGMRDQRSLVLVITISTYSAGSLTTTILGDPAGPAGPYTILASAEMMSAETITLSVGPGLPVTSNVSVNAVLPSQVQLSLVYATSANFTYSIDYILGY